MILDENTNDNNKIINSESNFIRLSGNIQLNKLDYNLKADIVEIDLITNNTKIFMLDDRDKVELKNTVK